MSKILFTMVLGATVALSAVAAAGGAQTSADPVQVQAAAAPMKGVGDSHGTGAGRTSAGRIQFELSAHERLNGDFGQIGVTVSTPTQDVSYSVDVTCANLNSGFPPATNLSEGLIQGVVTSVSPAVNVLGITVGSQRLTFIHDGGQPSSATPVDAFYDVNNFIPPNSCHTFLSFTTPNVEQGNVNIKNENS